MSKVMYAFWANTFGPSFKAPQKVVKNGEYWWHKNGDHYVRKPGFTNEGWICYAHTDKKRVSDFARGFLAARSVIGQFCNDA